MLMKIILQKLQKMETAWFAQQGTVTSGAWLGEENGTKERKTGGNNRQCKNLHIV